MGVGAAESHEDKVSARIMEADSWTWYLLSLPVSAC